jgi:hypothetical protein
MLAVHGAHGGIVVPGRSAYRLVQNYGYDNRIRRPARKPRETTDQEDKNMKKLLLKLAISVFTLFLAGAAILLYANNRAAAPPERADLQAALDAGIGWMAANRQATLGQPLEILWWMVQQSAERTGDPRLRALFAEYHATHLDNARNIWLPMFYPGRWVPFRNADIADLSDYKQHFIYAISCDPQLAEDPTVEPQLHADFCDRYPLRPACATHQLMGIRFMQRTQCGDPETNQAVVAELQSRIVRQLTWDPRVIDVYLQRVLMLVESGAVERVKPIWLQRVLAAQRPDGGWAGIDPVLEFGSIFNLSLGARGFSLAAPRSDFHATIQGVLLLSLLVHPESAAR